MKLWRWKGSAILQRRRGSFVMGPQRSGNLLSGFTSADQIVGSKCNCGDTGVPAATVLFAERGQVHVIGGLFPGVCADGDFGARGRGANTDRVKKIGIQIVWNKLIVTLEIQIADVEIDHAIASLGAFLQDANGSAMAIDKRRKVLLHNGQLNHLRERTPGEFGNQLGNQLRLRRCLNDQSELHGWFFQTDSSLRRSELSAIDDVAPFDQFGEGPGVESKFFSGNGGKKFRAGFVARVIKLLAGAVLTEVLGVGRRKEGALMVVKPPSKARRAGIFEIDDCIFVAVENSRVEGLRSAVNHATVAKFRTRVDAFAVEARKHGSRCGAIEAFVMKTDPDFHSGPAFHTARNPPASKANKDGRATRESQELIAQAKI